MEGTKDILELAVDTETNIILYGPGGYGKSKFVKHFLKEKGLSCSYVVGSKDLELEQLIGIPDMSQILNDSKHEIAFKNSPFMGADVLLLEEFLDVPDHIAAALKDVISAGGLRTRDKLIKSDIKHIIICTNRSPEEVPKTDSNKAFFIDRFPIHYKVDWEIKSAKKYYDLLKTNTNLTDRESTVLSRICEEAKVSPRLVLRAAKMYKHTGTISSVKVINGFRDIDVESIAEDVTLKFNIKFFTDSLNKMLTLINTHRNDIGILLSIQDEIEDFSLSVDLPEERMISFNTVSNTLKLKIKNLETALMNETPDEIKLNINETFRNFKNTAT